MDRTGGADLTAQSCVAVADRPVEAFPVSAAKAFRDDQVEAGVDRLGRTEPEQILRAGVPYPDDATEVGKDDAL